jgi:hypothetical protein
VDNWWSWSTLAGSSKPAVFSRGPFQCLVMPPARHAMARGILPFEVAGCAQSRVARLPEEEEGQLAALEDQCYLVASSTLVEFVHALYRCLEGPPELHAAAENYFVAEDRVVVLDAVAPDWWDIPNFFGEDRAVVPDWWDIPNFVGDSTSKEDLPTSGHRRRFGSSMRATYAHARVLYPWRRYLGPEVREAGHDAGASLHCVQVVGPYYHDLVGACCGHLGYSYRD